MRTARHRHGEGRAARTFMGSPGMRLLAVAGAIVLTTAACGNRSSGDKLNALLNGQNQGAAPAATAPGAAPTAEAPATGADAGSPAAVPAAGSAVAPGAGASSPAGAAAGPAARSAAGTAAATPAPGQKSAASAAPGTATRSAEPAGGSSGAAPGAPGKPGTPALPSAPAGCSGSEPPIVIGSVGTMSGVVGYLFAPGAKAVSAWAAEMNEKGGINCHSVKHLIGDSGGDPARYQALVRQFVEREGVIAFVFNPDSFAAQAGADYLEQKQVPVIGGGG